MDIGIFIEYDNRVVQIPVNPEKFNVSTGGNNETTEIVALGPIVIPGYKKLSSISWDSFFPYESWFPAVRTKQSFESSAFYVNFLNKIRDECRPCHLTVTGIGFDDDVVIDSFEYYHQAGDHEDTYYSISLTKYQPYTVSIVSVEDISAQLNSMNTQTSAPSSSTTPSPDPTPTPSTTTQTTPSSSALGGRYSGATLTPQPSNITIGCEVYLNGTVFGDSYGGNAGKTFTNYKCKVELVNKEGSHMYHVTDSSGRPLGWVSADSVSLVSKSSSSPTQAQIENNNNYNGTGGGPDRILMLR